MRLNKMSKPPVINSSEMRAYLAAILEVTGMMSGQGCALKVFLNNLATHMKPKVSFLYATLRESPNGLIYITKPGFRFFASRLSASPIVKGQHVKRSEILQMIRCIVAPTALSGWEQVDVLLEEEI